ncbi:MAG: hypothetical protein ABSG43_22820, partial [Solirubrobacteraceae bacterium]
MIVTAMFAVPGVASASAWSLARPPAPQVANGQLGAVNCTTSSACTAVGEAVDSSGTQVTLAERWNGTSWSIQATPNPSGATSSQLTGVRCPTSTTCTAVGYFTNSAGAQATLAERWDGTSWAIQSTPNAGGATGSQLGAVTCTSSTACIAVGSSSSSPGAYAALAEQWNGTSWSILTVPAPGGAASTLLDGVSCSAGPACTAVGRASDNAGDWTALAERWNGTRWSIQTVPAPGAMAGATLNAVSCPSSTTCTAVGFSYDDNGTDHTLADEWNGSGWSVQTSQNPAGANGSSLNSVSCPSTTACTAVGNYYPNSGGVASLAERWNGTTWALQSSPNRGGTDFSQLEGTSCTSSSDCRITVGFSTYLADGGFFFSNGLYATLGEGWNGTSWSIQSTLNPQGAANSELRGVRCAGSTTCTAVGCFINAAGQDVTLAVHWNGTNWTIQSTPNPAGTVSSQLDAVTCTSSDACDAVGTFLVSARYQAFAEQWNGEAWSIESVATPAGATGSSLDAISCASST